MPYANPEKRRQYQREYWQRRYRGKSPKYPAGTCAVCGATFFAPRKQRTCSRKCGARLAVNEGRQNSFPKKSGRYTNSHGYVMLYLPGHPMAIGSGKKWVPEHRYVMAEAMGRPLTSDELVHHRNAVKNDNRIENLELVTRRSHWGEVECPHCRRTFSLN